MKIEVTQSDIDAGEALNCRKCPLAIAIGRAFGAPAYVFRGFSLVGRRTYEIPVEAREFVSNFDVGAPVQPFSFELSEIL